MNPDVARKMLGKKAEHLTNADIENVISKFEYLAEGFLDKHERKIYRGKTLKQLLQNE